MDKLISKALTAKRETRSVEFKQGFDPQSPGEWCEVIKDLVAIANSGGGIIVFGLDNLGQPSGQPVDAIASVDPSDMANRVSKYTGPVDFDFEIRFLEKGGQKLVGFLIPGVGVPLIFQKPGTYDIGGGKQKTAFGVGTIYFRQGAKSEPGNSDDIRRTIERQLEQIRKSWVNGVRKVVTAPPGSQVVTIVSPTAQGSIGAKVTVVKDPKAIPVRLTRDPSETSGTFVHEEISDGIFDEINNVIDANRVLGKGNGEFLLGQSVYYRVYAERQHVKQPQEVLTVLLQNALGDFYAPGLFWVTTLPDTALIGILANLYLYPTNRHVHSLMRVGMLLGVDFCEWLLSKWTEKWKRHPQPPSFYFTFKAAVPELKKGDPILCAARQTPTSKVNIDGEPTVTVKDLCGNPEHASALLSKSCMKVFEGKNDYRGLLGILIIWRMALRLNYVPPESQRE
jgi:hypothetical protein